MSRNDQVIRIYRVQQVLNAHPRGLTVRQIHDIIQTDYQEEVSERTSRRDLEALEFAGFPIEHEEVLQDSAGHEDVIGQKVTRYKFQNTIQVGKSLVLTPSELMALFFSQGALSPLKGTRLFGELQSMFAKVALLIPERGRKLLEEISGEIHFEPGPRWALNVDPDVLETVRSACAEGQYLKLVYQSANSNGAITERRVGPHFLYFAKGSLYLVAKDEQDQAIKVFALPRVMTAEMTADPYEAPALDPEKYFAASFGVYQADQTKVISLRVAAPLAFYVKERRWHNSQQIVSNADGSITLKLEAGITPELVQWVLGLGLHAEVVEPPELREEVRKNAQSIVAKYAGDKLKKAS